MDKPQNLGIRGTSLWDNVTAATTFDAAGYHLLEDACRTADIIDHLTDMLNEDEENWLRVIEKQGFSRDDETQLILNIHPLLGEIRQQRLAMRQLMAQIGIANLASETDAAARESKDFWAAKEEEFKKG